MSTDADFETMNLVARATDAYNGVCSLCDEALYPLDPKWVNDYTERYTAQDAAAHVGAVHPQLPYHIWCLEDQAN